MLLQMNSISNKKENTQNKPGNISLQVKMPGVRNTSQRALILEIVHRGGGHLDADEVYRQARLKQPRISLSTVYRTLQTMKRLDLIEEVHIDETHHHYEVKRPGEHHHLVCIGCGKVIEFRYPLTAKVKKNVPKARDFEITGSEIRITGYCSSCKKNRLK
jgi:Fur family ferric uptake transcriptional regulator